MSRRNVAFGRIQAGTGVGARGGDLRGDDILLMRFASESRLPYVSIGVFCVGITPAVCRPAPNRDGLRYVSFLFRADRDRHSAFSDVLRLSDFTDSLQVCTFLYGDPDGERGQQRGVSMFLRNHISPAMLSAGNTLGLKCGSRTAAAPDCAKEPLALWTLFIWIAAWVQMQYNSLSGTSNACPLFSRRVTLGYMERPDRLQFMAGQVGLYKDVINTLNRPDSSRPQAAKSRVDTREAERNRHCRPAF